MHKTGLTQSAFYLKEMLLAAHLGTQEEREKSPDSLPGLLGAKGGALLWDNGK